MEQEQANFSGWAVVELYGHQREVGFVTTQHFGQASMFQIDVPPFPERETVLESPEYGPGEQWLPKGTKVIRQAREGRTRLVGVGAVYAMNPCTELAAMRAIENGGRRIIKVVELPADMKSLPAPGVEDDEDSDGFATQDEEF